MGVLINYLKTNKSNLDFKNSVIESNMKKINSSLRTAFIALLLFFIVSKVNAATYYSRVTTGNFSTVGSWSTSPTGTPTNGTALVATDLFIIQNGHNITLTAAQTVAGITINSGGTLTATIFVLTLNGPWLNNGTFNDGASSTVTFGGATAAINSGSGTENFQNISISNGTTMSINAPVEVAGTFSYAAISANTSISISGTNSLTVSGAMTMPRPSANGITCTFAVGAGTLSVVGTFTMSATTTTRNDALTISTGTVNLGAITTGTSGCLITFSGAGTMNISGTVTSSGSPAITPSTGTINFTGAIAQNIWLETYNNVGVSGAGTKTLAGNVTVGSQLIIDGTMSLGIRTLTLPSAGTPLVVNGTLTPATGTVIFSGTSAQNVAGTTYNNLTFSGAGTKTFLDGTSASLTGAWAIGAPAVLAGTANVDVSGTISGTSALTIGSGTLTAGGTYSHSGTFTAGTGTVNYDGAATQAVRIMNYYNLICSLAGTKTVATGTTLVVTNNWDVSSPITMTTTASANVTGDVSGNGVITMGSGQIALEGNWTNSATLVPGTGKIIYDGSGAQTVGGQPYYVLQTSVGGTKTLVGNSTIASVLTIGASSELNLSTFTLTLNAASIPLVNNGSFKPGTSTVAYTNAGSTTIAAVNYYNLNGTGGSRIFPGVGVIGIANIFTPGAGAYTVTGSTVSFNGTGPQTIPTFTFNDVILTNAGAKTIDTPVSVKNITIETGPTFNLNSTGGGILSIY